MRKGRRKTPLADCRKRRKIGEKFHCRAVREWHDGTGDGDQIKMKFFAKWGLSTRSKGRRKPPLVFWGFTDKKKCDILHV